VEKDVRFPASQTSEPLIDVAELSGEDAMIVAERDFALDQLDRSRQRLLATVQGLSREQLQFRSASDRWSVAECVEHIIIVEQFLLAGLERLAQQADDPSTHSDWNGRDEAFLAQVVGRARQLQAVEAHQPTGRWQTERLLLEFETTRARVRTFVASTAADLRSRPVVHPSLGRLDAYQLLLFVGAHCDRHRRQSEEVITAPGFPR
jgi:hypothetical protein